MGTFDNRHRKLVIDTPLWKSRRGSGLGASSQEDSDYWKDLEFPVTIQESGPIHYIQISPSKPHWVALTGSLKVQLFDSDSDALLKTLSKGKERVYGAKFRDEATLGLGTENGAVKVYSVGSKALLRDMNTGHTGPVQRIAFLTDKKHISSFSDDKTTILWDIPTGESVFKGEHNDYVRSGDASPVSSHLYASGSYDHTIKLWDKRQSTPVVTLDHGSPVEDILFLQGGALLASAGGHHVILWDLTAGKYLAKMSPHSKTITSLSTSNNGTRIVSASLDRKVVFSDITSTFKPVFSLSSPSPLLRVAVSPDDKLICTGSSDGLVQFLHRRAPEISESELLFMKRKEKNKYLTHMNFKPSVGDMVVPEFEYAHGRENKFDMYLRKFEFSKALDSVLRMYIQKKHPQYTYSVLKELKRRKMLSLAIAGRDDKSLGLLLTFATNNVNKMEYASLIHEVIEIVADLYADKFGVYPTLDKAFDLIRKKVEREAKNMQTLMELKGSLSMMLSAAKTSEPVLRYEENELRLANKGKKGKTSSKVPMAWEKMLLDI
ncbi:U3 small nucleolar RNA-associated protein 15 homolog [Lepeophtheirus salmonis]|uniref:U3 small nucleolar RNA-associated protein 15 homolog n=1 Tax=Lepeophtheirus salmonis TaxID=72036 RepID=UPI001AE47B3A|nr:U3 small nucleolar RNA-associated protein 15 homolog [Lepeophtheirus salmonis]